MHTFKSFTAKSVVAVSAATTLVAGVILGGGS